LTTTAAAANLNKLASLASLPRAVWTTDARSRTTRGGRLGVGHAWIHDSSCKLQTTTHLAPMFTYVPPCRPGAARPPPHRSGQGRAPSPGSLPLLARSSRVHTRRGERARDEASVHVKGKVVKKKYRGLSMNINIKRSTTNQDFGPKITLSNLMDWTKLTHPHKLMDYVCVLLKLGSMLVCCYGTAKLLY
jgi:hypothetical protein